MGSRIQGFHHVSSICVTGGTGYIGRRLIPLLATRGHEIRAVVRESSQDKLPSVTSIVVADPLKDGSYTEAIKGADTFVHLIGVPHPSPAKAAQFRAVDLPSAQVALNAARSAGIRHFIYLSVAQPAPMMQAFIAVRSEGEAMIRASGLDATFVRPGACSAPAIAGLTFCCRSTGWRNDCRRRVKEHGGLVWSPFRKCSRRWSGRWKILRRAFGF